MKSTFIEKQITYDGTQLCSHWILKTTHIKGDAIAAFIGPAVVPTDHMVDLEDVASNKPIFSEMMLHFIVEHFTHDLDKVILCQRLLISQIQQELNEKLIDKKIMRRGDDLFLDQDKLTVSIATASPISCLIHTGINISSHKTPIPTKGLNDFDIHPERFGKVVMQSYVDEIEGVRLARCKVKGVE